MSSSIAMEEESLVIIKSSIFTLFNFWLQETWDGSSDAPYMNYIADDYHRHEIKFVTELQGTCV